MKIQVTQEDINKGERHLIHTCPIALALTRHFERQCWASNLALGFSKGEVINKTPPEVSEFMARFDGYEIVEPFEFEIVRQ